MILKWMLDIKMLEIYIELWATNMISFEMDLKTVIIIL
jgi:hypothetical protein